MSFPVGSRVRFERRSRDKSGHAIRRTETGTVVRFDQFTYVLQTDAGGTFIRRLNEVEEVSE